MPKGASAPATPGHRREGLVDLREDDSHVAVVGLEVDVTGSQARHLDAQRRPEVWMERHQVGPLRARQPQPVRDLNAIRRRHCLAADDRIEWVWAAGHLTSTRPSSPSTRPSGEWPARSSSCARNPTRSTSRPVSAS